jgi:choline dehydrogenase-like flavoprotein
MSDPFDVERLAEGYRRGHEVASKPELRRLCDAPPWSGTRGADELPGLIRAEGYSFPHVVGTCSMGSAPDEGAVVDPAGRVHGTERFSVVDASIVPNEPSGFTHIPTVMLAERLSELIATSL